MGKSKSWNRKRDWDDVSEFQNQQNKLNKNKFKKDCVHKKYDRLDHIDEDLD